MREAEGGEGEHMRDPNPGLIKRTASYVGNKPQADFFRSMAPPFPFQSKSSPPSIFAYPRLSRPYGMTIEDLVNSRLPSPRRRLRLEHSLRPSRAHLEGSLGRRCPRVQAGMVQRECPPEPLSHRRKGAYLCWWGPQFSRVLY